jgi:hypothetical protein
MRVRPSSTTSTRTSPRSALAISASTASGTMDSPIAMTTTAAAAIQNMRTRRERR